MKKLIAIFFILIALPCFADTHYVAKDGTDSGDCTGSACLTISYAEGQLTSGDTLEIGDGTYAENPWDADYLPDGPGTGSGDARFTIVKAENNGGVLIDGGATGRVVDWTTEIDYIKFEGIKFTHSKSGEDLIHIASTSSDHIYFKRCGFYRTGDGGAATVWSPASYQLYEECYFWGRGRYGLNLRTPGDYSIVRRCVFRLDASTADGLVIGAAIAYEHDYVEWQNNIVIDMDRDLWTDYTYPEAGLLTHAIADGDGTHYNNFRGNVILNVDSHYTASSIYGYGILLDGSTTTNCTLENNIIWGNQGNGLPSGGGINNTIDNNTVGDIQDSGGVVGDGIQGYDGTSNSITDTIVYGCRDDGILSSSGVNYNCVNGNGDDYDGTTPGANDVSYSPLTNGLLYLPRIETGSNLKTAGTGGGQIGADVTKRYGIDGTFYGENISGGASTDYKDLTETDLWPFTYEAQIKTDFSADTGTTDETRGFCSTDANPRTDTGIVTLTSYIWEYLGNNIPSDIYNLGLGSCNIGTSGTGPTISNSGTGWTVGN